MIGISEVIIIAIVAMIAGPGVIKKIISYMQEIYQYKYNFEKRAIRYIDDIEVSSNQKPKYKHFNKNEK